MLASGSDLDVIIGARAAGDKTNLNNFLRSLVRHGASPVLLEPNGKLPICPLPYRTQTVEDRKARELARLNGVTNWDKVKHPCGINHAISRPEEVDKHLKNQLEVFGVDTLNVGLEVGRSKLVVVDVDTVTENQAFIDDYRAATDSDIGPYTVESPGVMISGEWIHQGGGHYWFTLPDEVDLSQTGTGTYKSPTGWSMFWRDRQVLIPPSVRTEGPYRLTGPFRVLPDWLLKTILERTAPKKG